MLPKKYSSILNAVVAIVVACIFIGCDSKYQLTSISAGEVGVGFDEGDVAAEEKSSNKEKDESQKLKKRGQLKNAGYEFESPQRVKGRDEFVKVESPGYACPTLADLDGDGKLDLVVGQFREGNMQFFKNVAADKNGLKFAAGKWLMSGDERAVVPGVW